MLKVNPRRLALWIDKRVREVFRPMVYDPDPFDQEKIRHEIEEIMLMIMEGGGISEFAIQAHVFDWYSFSARVGFTPEGREDMIFTDFKVRRTRDMVYSRR